MLFLRMLNGRKKYPPLPPAGDKAGVQGGGAPLASLPTLPSCASYPNKQRHPQCGMAQSTTTYGKPTPALLQRLKHLPGPGKARAAGIVHRHPGIAKLAFQRGH